MRPVLVGMNNPRGAEMMYALYPWPCGCAGERLWRLINDADPSVTKPIYVGAFDRRNLCEGPWDARIAAAAADGVADELRGSGAALVMLGRQVCRAFGLGDLEPLGRVRRGGVDFHHVPHPSGRCLWYNSPENRAAAGRRLVHLMRRSA